MLDDPIVFGPTILAPREFTMWQPQAYLTLLEGRIRVAELCKHRHNLGLLLKFRQGSESWSDISPVQMASLFSGDGLHIEDISWPEGKEFLDHQIFGRTGSEFTARFEFKKSGALDGKTFKRESGQRNIDGDVIWRLQQ